MPRATQQIVQARFSQEIYSGPLPHPEILEKFDILVPGMAEKLMENFLEQSRHRRSLESYHVRGSSIRSWAGLVLGFIVAIGGIIAAINIGGVAGAALGGVDIAGIVGVFVYGTRSQRGERVEKSKAVKPRGR